MNNRNISPAIVILLPLVILVTLVNLFIHLAIWVADTYYPYLERFAIATYRTAKVYLSALLTVVATKATHASYYFRPTADDGAVDAFIGVLMSDICGAIAYMCKAGCRTLAQENPNKNEKVRCREVCE